MKSRLIIKRILDFLFSFFGIIILAPFFLIIAILIKTSSKGPVFFLQNRLGEHGKVFRIVKFRTMVENAEQMGDGLIVKNESDSRITKVGKFLRSTSLDELPQLFNVIKGDMSLVGPRPPVPYHPYKYNEYNDLQRERFTMKPGITGLSQVKVRNSVSWDERIRVDLKYINNFSLLLDIKIIFKTLRKIFISESIYLNEDSQL